MIKLRDITPDNHVEVRSLAVRPDQERFVATVDKSLADAFVWKDALVKSGYVEDIPVGFVMIFPFEEDGTRIVNIARLLVDAKFQGKGIGRDLLTETLNWIDSLSPDRIRISTLPENEPALSLYKDVGFIQSGIEDGEIALYINKARDT